MAGEKKTTRSLVLVRPHAIGEAVGRGGFVADWKKRGRRGE